MNKKTIVIAGVVALVLIAVGAIIYATNQTPKQAELAAVVNGVPITLEAFEKQLAALEQSGEQYAAGEKDERMAELEKLTIDQMVDNELSRQMAAEAGIEVTDDEVAEQYDLVVQAVGGEDEFAKTLEAQDMTTEELHEQIRTQMLVQGYIDAEVGTPQIDDAEVAAEYNANKANYTDEGGATLPLEEVRDQIRDMLVAEAQTDAFNKKLDAYKEKSSIAIFVANKEQTDE